MILVYQILLVVLTISALILAVVGYWPSLSVMPTVICLMGLPFLTTPSMGILRYVYVIGTSGYFIMFLLPLGLLAYESASAGELVNSWEAMGLHAVHTLVMVLLYPKFKKIYKSKMEIVLESK